MLGYEVVISLSVRCTQGRFCAVVLIYERLLCLFNAAAPQNSFPVFARITVCTDYSLFGQYATGLGFTVAFVGIHPEHGVFHLPEKARFAVSLLRAGTVRVTRDRQ